MVDTKLCLRRDKAVIVRNKERVREKEKQI